MTRPIKFRAWDTERKEMVHFDSPNFCHEYGTLTFDIKEYPGIANYPGNSDFSTWKLMQFTGLHDKNGVEIYEGDILKGAPSGWKKEFQIFYLAEVYFGDCGWRAKEKLLDRELPIHIHMQGSCGVEVIGNVYENPELLEEKK